jgi:adenine-specific DNA methylase
MEAGFIVVAAHPIKAEMSVAAPKHLAKEPIDLDIILVCRKRDENQQEMTLEDLWVEVLKVSEHQVARLRETGRKLSRNDLLVIVMAQVVRQLSRLAAAATALSRLEREVDTIPAMLDRLAAR